MLTETILVPIGFFNNKKPVLFLLSEGSVSYSCGENTENYTVEVFQNLNKINFI